MARKKTRRNRSRRASGQTAGPSTKAVVYRGPIPYPPSRGAEETFMTVMNFPTDITSTAGGVIANVIGADPSTITNWASFAAIFREYRVLGVGVEWVPETTATSFAEVKMYMVWDRASSAALGTYGEAGEYASAKFMFTNELMLYHSTNAARPIEIRMDSTDEASWYPTSSITVKYWLKLFASGLAASQTYGFVNQKFRVQFRNRR